MVRIVGMYIAQISNANIFVQIKQQFGVWYFTNVAVSLVLYWSDYISATCIMYILNSYK